ncbi:tetratricopeptide repeat protein [candidate division WOR-3 bacterium]|nr:tetratricopeptide repeat protein [candidate division WOR-3 bacterium]
MWISMFILLPSLKDAGNHFFASHQYNKAIKTYKMVLRENPSSEIRLRLGVSFYMIGDYFSAERWLLKAQESKVKNQRVEADNILKKIYFKRGISEFKKGDLNSALFWFEEAQNRYGIASTLYKLGDEEEAREILQELTEKGDVVGYKSMYALGIINYQEGQFQEALAWFKKLELTRDVSGAIGATLYRMGAYESALDYFRKEGNNFFIAECYYRLEEFEESEKCYKKYLAVRNQKIAPTYELDALYGLAWAHYKLGEFSISAEEFASCKSQVASHKLQAVCAYYAGRSYLKIGELNESIRCFEKLLDGYPEYEFAPNSHYWLGKAYFIQGEYHSAMSEFEELLSNYPQSELSQYAYLMIGSVYYKTEQYDSAIVWYNRVNNYSSDKTCSNWLLDEARFKIEECYFRLGEYGSRIDILRNFVRKYPKSKRTPKFKFELAQYWESQNNFREAIRTYTHIIQEFSWSSLAQRAKLGLSECYFRIGSHEKAIKTCKELIHTNLRVYAQAQLARIHFLLAQYDKAIYEYEVLVNDFPEGDAARDARYQIGLCYEYLGSQNEARITWQTFINKYPEDPKIWEIWLKLARTYWEEGFTGKYEKVLLYIENQGEKRPKYEANFLLGSLYQDRNDYKDAQSFYLKAVSQYEDIDSKSRALIGAAQCAKSLGNLEKAQEFYREVILLQPNPVLEEIAKKEIKSLIIPQED